MVHGKKKFLQFLPTKFNLWCYFRGLDGEPGRDGEYGLDGLRGQKGNRGETN